MALNFVLEDDNWTAEVRLATWQGFQSRRGPYAGTTSDAPSDDWTTIVFAPDSERGVEPLTADEIASVEWLVDNEGAIGAAVLAALVAEYPKIKETYGDFAAEQGSPMPDVHVADDFKHLIGLYRVYVHAIRREDLPYIGFLFGCTWDREHGLGVLMNGTRVVEIGGADTAFLSWIAEDDVEKA